MEDNYKKAVKNMLRFFINEIKIFEIREIKNTAVRNQNYEEAAKARDQERILLEEIPSAEEFENLLKEIENDKSV